MLCMWAGKDSNLRRRQPADLQSAPLSTRAPTLEGDEDSVLGMPTFDVVSQVECRRSATPWTRRPGKSRPGSTSRAPLERGASGPRANAAFSTEDRLKAVLQVLEEKLVRRKMSLKALEMGKVEEAAKSTVRQLVTLKAGISSDQARAINRFIKDNAPKGVSSRPRENRCG